MINIDFLEKYTGDAIITSKNSHTYKELVNRIYHYEAILKDFTNKRIAVIGDFDLYNKIGK